ncbi:uncharacterized protein Z520_12349 [Fonsecaea multimorphosa CBS 102226]|uniref:Ketoreductase domain-containing protein n=1 Tax=Fonsecaea multimorphosa CBS 102226 TaxID=1442371 RepID=A0A0D2GR29_9EURO|nr:uncharacterized protein Z520_12349 [Fonsecaea multimorphosa CBS 102226]KIX91960.1 hypothetical protein Z520_12349 [Fonsecaea multimorphosa CBS 102226]OAL17331.1 hypothetical protein AYO22_11773 [Fonsecaea multimorphosa]
MSELPNFDNFFNLDGKVALVTGGSRGLGLHAATAFLRAGAKTVFITARKTEGPQGINQAVEKLNALPYIKGEAIGIAANVAQEKEVQKLCEEVKKIEPKLHILVANAGATWGGPFDTTPDWANQKVLDLNVRGVFNIVRSFAPLLEAAGTPEDPARVVVVSSTAGTNVHHVGEHGTIMYSASKAAAHHLTRNLAVELGPRNITTNTVAPGFFPSKLANGLIEILGGEEDLKKSNPRQRLGMPEDIAGVMLFLTSPVAGYM